MASIATNGGVSEVRKNLRRIRKFCCLSTDKAGADLEAMGWVGGVSARQISTGLECLE